MALAVLAGGCGIGNHMAETQAPAEVSGTVLAGPGCPPSGGGVALPCLVRAVPGAVVLATGKDGVNRVEADGAGHYRLALLTGEWSIAAEAPGGAPGPAAQRFLAAGRTYHLDLRAG